MILSAQSLSKNYGSGRHPAVRGVTLELQPGDFVSIVGRSGSGKSTLLAMLGALTRPSEGRVLFEGTDLWALSEVELAAFRSRYIGFIFQFPSLLSSLTAIDNVAVPALLGRTMSSGAAYARACRLLSRVGLASRADAYPADLSGGEQRRVAIARALINSPRLLLADEPTSDLDEDTEADIIELLEGLQRSDAFGFLLVTHNLEFAQHAPCTYEMRQGVLAPLAEPRSELRPTPQPRRFGPAEIGLEPVQAAAEPSRLGANLWCGVQVTVLGGAVFLVPILLADFGVAKYEEMQIRENGVRPAQLADIALSALQSEVQSVTDLGEGQYELAVALRNVRADPSIYVMPPDMRGYVQIGRTWREIPLRPAADAPIGVSKIDGKSSLSFPVRSPGQRLHTTAAELRACAVFGHNAGEPERHPKGGGFRAQGQLLRPPKAIRRVRRDCPASDEIHRQTARRIPMPPH